MVALLIGFIVTLAVGAVVLLWACCAAAGRADDAERQEWQDRTHGRTA